MGSPDSPNLRNLVDAGVSELMENGNFLTKYQNVD